MNHLAPFSAFAWLDDIIVLQQGPILE